MCIKNGVFKKICLFFYSKNFYIGAIKLLVLTLGINIYYLFLIFFLSNICFKDEENNTLHVSIFDSIRYMYLSYLFTCIFNYTMDRGQCEIFIVLILSQPCTSSN